MKTNFERVKKFHKVMGIEESQWPTIKDELTRTMRMSLIYEEIEELEEALDEQDLVEIADALTDTLYVVYGMGAVYGIDLDACFKEVHRSNMTKCHPATGKPILREDGKILKGEWFSPPNLRKFIE